MHVCFVTSWKRDKVSVCVFREVTSQIFTRAVNHKGQIWHHKPLTVTGRDHHEDPTGFQLSVLEPHPSFYFLLCQVTGASVCLFCGVSLSCNLQTASGRCLWHSSLPMLHIQLGLSCALIYMIALISCGFSLFGQNWP